MSVRTEEGRVRQALRQGLKGLGILTVVLVLVNAFAMLASHVQTSYGYTPTWQDYSAEFGLVSGEEYPLELGQTIAGSSGEIKVIARRGYFTAAVGSISPDQALSMSFQSKGRSYILSLPFSKTTFVQKEGVKPTVRVKISAAQADYDTTVGTPNRVSCYVVLCFNVNEGDHAPVTTSVDWPNILDEGLGTLVAEQVEGVTVTLSPELYQELLGGTGPEPGKTTTNN